MTINDLILVCGNLTESTPIIVYDSMARLMRDEPLTIEVWGNLNEEILSKELRFFMFDDNKRLTVIYK